MSPLEGITVVTLEHAVAGPFCTRQLADLGALGQHTDAILRELGYDANTIARLHREGAV